MIQILNMERAVAMPPTTGANRKPSDRTTAASERPGEGRPSDAPAPSDRQEGPPRPDSDRRPVAETEPDGRQPEAGRTPEHATDGKKASSPESAATKSGKENSTAAKAAKKSGPAGEGGAKAKKTATDPSARSAAPAESSPFATVVQRLIDKAQAGAQTTEASPTEGGVTKADVVAGDGEGAKAGHEVSSDLEANPTASAISAPSVADFLQGREFISANPAATVATGKPPASDTAPKPVNGPPAPQAATKTNATVLPRTPQPVGAPADPQKPANRAAPELRPEGTAAPAEPIGDAAAPPVQAAAAAAANPAQTVAAANPAQTVAAASPAQTVAVESPAQTVAVESPAQTVVVESPAPSVAAATARDRAAPDAARLSTPPAGTQTVNLASSSAEQAAQAEQAALAPASPQIRPQRAQATAEPSTIEEPEIQFRASTSQQAQPGPGVDASRVAAVENSVEAVSVAAAPAEPVPAFQSPAAEVATVTPAQVDPVTAEAPQPAAAPPQPALRSSPVDQIVESAALTEARAGQRVVVRLNPPELGTARLTLRQDGSGVRGVLEVQDARALAELQQATPPMIQRLAESGIQMRSLDITLSNPGEQGLGGGSDGSLRGNGFAQQQDDGQGAGGQGASAGGTDGDGLGELQGAAAAATASYVSDESINVWM